MVNDLSFKSGGWSPPWMGGDRASPADDEAGKGDEHRENGEDHGDDRQLASGSGNRRVSLCSHVEPGAVPINVVLGSAVFDFGSTMVSSDSAVPEWQFTGPPPTACQVSPVTLMARAGYRSE